MLHQQLPIHSKPEWACKPGSVESDHFSGVPITQTPQRIRPGRQTQRTTTCGTNKSHRFDLLGLAPGGVYHARAVTNSAVRSYRTISPLPACGADIGGILSVALSRSSRTVGVTHHRVLRSPDFPLPYSCRSRNDSDHSAHSGNVSMTRLTARCH